MLPTVHPSLCACTFFVSFLMRQAAALDLASRVSQARGAVAAMRALTEGHLI